MNSPVNVGSLFRLCDALAIEKLYLCGSTPQPPNSKINKTSRSAEKHVAYEFHNDAAALVLELKAAATLIVALELTTSSIDLRSTEFAAAINNRKSICLILGSENTGVNKTLLSLADITVHIKMLGHNSSMNVITAAGITAYEIIGQLDES